MALPQPLDTVFLLLTAIIPAETILQAATASTIAFGRFITPVFITLYLILRPKNAVFVLPPGLTLVLPYFAISFYHIAAQESWLSFYNYRSYALNLITAIAVYNYCQSNRPNIRHILYATFAGVFVAAVVSLIYFGDSPIARDRRFDAFQLDENLLGSTYGLAVVIATTIVSTTGVSLAAKTLTAAGSSIVIWLTLATGSRGAVIAVLISILAHLIAITLNRGRGYRTNAFVACIAIGVCVIAFLNSSLARDRLEAILDSGDVDRFGNRDRISISAAKVILQKPVFGWGESAGWLELANQTEIVTDGSSALGTHNTFLLLFITSGLLAGGAFSAWILKPLYPRQTLLADRDYLCLYIAILYLTCTFLTLDRLAHRQWWWLFPVFLAATRRSQVAARLTTPRLFPAL